MSPNQETVSFFTEEVFEYVNNQILKPAFNVINMSLLGNP